MSEYNSKRSRLTDVRNKRVVTGGERKWGRGITRVEDSEVKTISIK